MKLAPLCLLDHSAFQIVYVTYCYFLNFAFMASNPKKNSGLKSTGYIKIIHLFTTHENPKKLL